jgi:glycosyltransferase involved in cell wall biosynthesis
MISKKVTFVYSLKNTFVEKDIALLEQIGCQVKLIESLPHKAFFPFIWNRIKEFIGGFFYVLNAEAVFSWFNDYHATALLFWAKCFNKQSVLIVGGYDAVSYPKWGYGIFVNRNFRNALARWNFKNTTEIWVVHKSLAEGCSTAKSQDQIASGILNFMPDLKTPIREIPTGYDPRFWNRQTPKSPKTILTVANISDERTYQRKGIPLFIKLAKALPNYQFTIAGINKNQKGKKKIPNNVTLLGTLTRKELRLEYSKHQFYFQGSKIEGLPNVLCEAMLCECVPLGTKVFGIPDAIGPTGYILNESKDLNSLVQFIKTYEEASNLGKQARKRIEKMFPIELRKKRFEDFLNRSENAK